MDRVEFIESLQQRLSEVESKKAELQTECDKAYKRTWEYIKERFEPKENNNVNGLNFVCGGTDIAMHNTLYTHVVARSNNTTEQIIDLGHKIRTVEEEISELQKKITIHKLNDVVAFIMEMDK